MRSAFILVVIAATAALISARLYGDDSAYPSETISETSTGERERPTSVPTKGTGGWRAYKESKRAEYEKWLAQLEIRRASLGPLERLAIQSDFNPPEREAILSYRFTSTEKLQSMLRDPQWSEHWAAIAVTIAMVADKKSANDLMEFIGNGNAPAGAENEFNRARYVAVGALRHVLVDQNIPEVVTFLEQLADQGSAQSLDVSRGISAADVRTTALFALSSVGSDASIAALERIRDRAKQRVDRQQITPASVGSGTGIGPGDELARVEKYLEDARRRQAGLPPQPPKEGDPIE